MTLTSQSGKTINVLASQVSEEFIHLNGHVEPIATVSIPRDTYISASATYAGNNPNCNGQSPGSINFDALTDSPNETINLPNPITVDGTAMGLVLNLTVSAFPGSCPSAAEFPSIPPITAAFDLTPLTIASGPTNSTNGLMQGLEGVISSINSGAGAVTVNGIVTSEAPPTWQISLNNSTVLRGISGAAQLTVGMPVDMDVAIQADGSFAATRISAITTAATNLTAGTGPLVYVSDTEPLMLMGAAEEQGYLLTTSIKQGGLPGGGDIFTYFNFDNSQFQVSDQFENLTSLPFAASFNSTTMVPGQNVTVTTQATTLVGGPTYNALTTMTLRPQTINGTVSAISSAGSFTTYTVTLAGYSLFPQFATQPGQTTLLTDPNTVLVYADSSTQMLNQSAPAVGSTLRFYGLVFNDSGTLRMDCGQVNNGVSE